MTAKQAKDHPLGHQDRQLKSRRGYCSYTSDKEEHFLVRGAGDENGVSRKASLRAGDQ